MIIIGRTPEEIDAQIGQAKSFETRRKLHRMLWAEESRERVRREKGTAQGHDFVNCEPWVDLGDHSLKYASGEKSPYGAWTLNMLRVLACLHRTVRNFWIWTLKEEDDLSPVRERFDTVLAIARECGVSRCSVFKVLKKLQSIGAVEVTSVERCNRKIYDITEKGERVLWTGIYKRISRRTKFMDNPDFWTPMPQGLMAYEFDALSIVRTIINTRACLIAGTDKPQYERRAKVQNLRNGKQRLIHRRVLVIENANRLPVGDAWGRMEYLPYCWKPSLVWQVLRRCPLGYIQRVLKTTIRRVKDGEARNFFAYSFGRLLPGAMMVGNRLVFNRDLARIKRFEGLQKFARGNAGVVWDMRLSGARIMDVVRAVCEEKYFGRSYDGPMTTYAA